MTSTSYLGKQILPNERHIEIHFEKMMYVPYYGFAEILLYE